MKSIRPRIIALDIDDTLLRTDLSISYKTRKTIKRTVEAGITVALASGRIPETLERYSRFLRLHASPGYIISNNGALITESHTGNIVHQSLLDRKTILAICDLADSEGFPLQIYDSKIAYISRKHDYSSVDEQLTGLRQVVVENFRDMVGEGCYKLIIPGDPELLVHVEKIISSYMESNLSFFISRKYFLQVTPEGTNKGTALAKIADSCGVKAEEVMAIGDSMNDESMIRWAGIGVAMANGNEGLKKMAAIVTDKTNDEDGLADFLEKYLFNQEGPEK